MAQIYHPGYTPLMHLVDEKNFLVSEDIQPFLDIINEQDERGRTALMIACITVFTNRSIKTVKLTVKLLLEHGANPNIQDEDGWTALMFACKYHNKDGSIEESVKLLLENGANINILNLDGSTALVIAIQYSYYGSSTKTVKLLLENGANLTGSSSYSREIMVILFELYQKYKKESKDLQEQIYYSPGKIQER